MKTTILITNLFNVYIPEIYGADTWGDGYHQESMIFEKGTWKVCDWHYGGKFKEDSYEEYELPVLATFESVRKAKSFLIKNNHREKIKDLDILIDMSKKIEEEFGEGCKKRSVRKSKKS